MKINFTMWAWLFTVFITIVGCSPGEKGSSDQNLIQSIGSSDTSTLRMLKEVEWPKAYATQDTLLLDRILGEDF